MIPVYSTCADVRDIVSAQPWTDRFPYIGTDWPYDTVDRHRNEDSPSLRLKSWFETMDADQSVETLGLLRQNVLDPRGFITVCVDWASMYEFMRADEISFKALKGYDPPVGRRSGLRWRHPFIWVKTTKGSARKPKPGMGWYGRYAMELILVLQGPDKPYDWTKRALRKVTNVIYAPSYMPRGSRSTQKPMELAQQLLHVFAAPERPFFDPFAGVGAWWHDAIEGSPWLGIPEIHYVDIDPDAPCHRLANQEAA